jgi:hypothetical protein
MTFTVNNLVIIDYDIKKSSHNGLLLLKIHS